MNWTNLLTEIRDNPQNFLEQGGWGFLHEESGSEEEEKQPGESDSNFEPEEKSEVVSDSDGDYSEEESEEASDDPDAELEEEGLSWDELEEEAEESIAQ